MKDEIDNAAVANASSHALVKSKEFQEAFDSPPMSILVTDATEDDDYDQDDDQDECDDEGDGENKNKDMAETHKKMKRILANRGSARASYQRRKKMIAELQATVTSQSVQNAAMEAENKLLRDEIQELRQQVRGLLLRQMPARHPSVGRRPETSLSAALSMGLSGSRAPLPAHLLAHTIAASQPSPSITDWMRLLSKKNLAGMFRGMPPPSSGMH